MCGIIGFINCGSKNELINSSKLLIHRGPDDFGLKWFDNDNSGIAQRRLSIIDITASGHQPMYNHETGDWIVFNGEIFNYLELKNELIKLNYSFKSTSDTEVILKAYQHWGVDFLNRLNGMFAFGIYNEKTKYFLLSRDAVGIKPLYYYLNGNKIVFSSEIKAILESSIYDKEPDYESLFTPAHFQIFPYTGFKNIHKLRPGSYLEVIGNKASIKQYWQLRCNEDEIGYEDAFEQLDFLLNDSISKQMISDVPIGSLLSGGLDSSLISVLMDKQSDSPIHTFTIKFKDDDLKRQGNVDDSYYAMKLAQQFNFKHQEIVIKPDIIDLLPKIIWHLDEPIADPAAINTYLISKAASDKGIKVLLTGMGADEVFSGYRAHLACLKAEKFMKTPRLLRDFIINTIDHLPVSNQKKDFKYFRWMKAFVNLISKERVERGMLKGNSALTEDMYNEYFINPIEYSNTPYVYLSKQILNEYSNLSYLTQLCYYDTMVYLPDHNLTYSDKSMMAASIEGRPPLIDKRIIELMFSLKPEFRIKGNTQKYLLKKVSEKYLPKEIIYRPKAPFSAPMRGWLKNELKEMVNDILSYDAIKKRGVYNPEYINKLIKNNELGIEDNSQLIWRLLVNELWFKIFFDK